MTTSKAEGSFHWRTEQRSLWSHRHPRFQKGYELPQFVWKPLLMPFHNIPVCRSAIGASVPNDETELKLALEQAEPRRLFLDHRRHLWLVIYGKMTVSTTANGIQAACRTSMKNIASPVEDGPARRLFRGF